MSLFNQKLCEERIAKFNFPSGEKAKQIKEIIFSWQNALRNGDLSKAKEKSIQGSFLIKFFEEILGYPSQTTGKEEWNFIQHPTTEVDSQEPDGSLGFFSKKEKQTRAVIELKDAKTLLDKKQSGREKGYTPIEQAYLYATKFDRCSWIIVSNFKEIRLYHKNRTQDFYESFDVLGLHKLEEFKRFYYFLCKENLISRSHPSVIDNLANETTKEDKDITFRFYQDYKNIRLNLYYDLVEKNPEVEKTLLLEKAQKILDRIIFILFCEDTGGLLPKNLIHNTYDLGIKSRERSNQRVWREFKNLFMDIDLGRNDVDPEINRYNGGLFAPDPILDNLAIIDTSWERIISLNKYNFKSELNVNLLGHIFEQSISDIENFKADLWGRQAGDDISRRKQDGIYYTPEFITKYLIESVVGRFLTENPDKLETIKILDPACGSGAFLNQAHTYLMNEYNIRNEQKLLEKQIAGIQQLDLTDVNIATSDRGILLNNLFGVDLNPESVEITKLALWLKTAHKSQPLENLDKNIKCGDSIVDDPSYAGIRAFSWEDEFRNIIANGGFDVIIGNPPYVRQELIKDIKPYLEKRYQVYTGVSDLYVYFFEKAMSLLSEGGYFAFIVSNKFLRANYGQKLTQYLQQNFTILNIIDFGDLQIFEGATTYPCIITIQKKKPAEIQRVSLLQITSLEKVSSLDLEVKENSVTIEIKKDDLSWQLRSVEENNLLEKLKKDSISLGDFVHGELMRGIITGFNDAFIIDNTTRDKICKVDTKEAEVLKPLLIGKDISTYLAEWEGLWVVVIPSGWTDEHRNGIDPEIFIQQTFPAIYNHLKSTQKLSTTTEAKPRRKGLYDREDQGDYWWELRPCDYYNSFTLPKIIWGNLATTASFSYDVEGFYINAPACMLPTNEKWLLALLNSSVSTFFLRNTAIERQGGFIEQKPVYVKQIPIPNVNADLRNILTEKVEMLLAFNLKKQEIQKQALQVLKARYRLLKVTQKLDKFLNLDWNVFLEELEKQKIKIDLIHQDELNVWFRSKQNEVKKLNADTIRLCEEIDIYVYRLYNLTDSEIKLIERITRVQE